MPDLKPFTVDESMARLRKVREDAEQSQSLAPIRAFFDGLTKYIQRHNPDKIALANWARFYSLWDAHFEKWYCDFKEGKS